MFHMALVGNADALVLGAIGCGAFLNPPRAVADALKELLVDGEFKGCFAKVDLAVIKSVGNLRAFQEAFE